LEFTIVKYFDLLFNIVFEKRADCEPNTAENVR
jgi:hypothetical protein